MSPRTMRAALVALMVVGGPVLFAFDILMRSHVVGEQPEDVRAMLGELLTRFAWYVVPTPVLGGIAGFLLYPRFYAWQLRRSSPMTAPETAAQNADLTALMMAASVPQLPALLGDFSVVLGAQVLPAICSTSLSALAVLLIACFARAPAEAARG